MSIRSSPTSSHVTLVGTTVLHAFTHAYATMLVPLYLLVRDDLRLPGVSYVALIVTLYGVVYWALSYPAGILADRYDRRLLLGVGLLGNAAAILGVGIVGTYPALVVGAVVAGVFGSLFHPTANALVPALYPRAPGMAIGLLGIGSGVGFFAGPLYAGLSARYSTWGEGVVSAWQRPFVELGTLGLLVGVAYLLTAREAGPHHASPKPPLPPGTKTRALLHAGAISLREFAGVGSITLGGLYLLKALGYREASTGAIVGGASLVAVVVNPLLVYLTAGTRRLPWHAGIIVAGAFMLACLPHLPTFGFVAVAILAQTFLLASSAVGDAGLAERLTPEVRGRVNGVFLTWVGSSAALAPWVIGAAVDRMPTHTGFVILYSALAFVALLATISARTLGRMGTTATTT
jgi:MFS transporter, FSR family, fosmidomycin resistance protein